MIGLCYSKAGLPTVAAIVVSIKVTNSKAELQMPYLALQFLPFKWSISTPLDVSDAKIDTDAPSACSKLLVPVGSGARMLMTSWKSCSPQACALWISKKQISGKTYTCAVRITSPIQSTKIFVLLFVATLSYFNLSTISLHSLHVKGVIS